MPRIAIITATHVAMWLLPMRDTCDPPLHQALPLTLRARSSPDFQNFFKLKMLWSSV